MADLGQADYAFLNSAEAEVVALSDRLHVLVCTILWLVCDYFVQRVCPMTPAKTPEKLYLGDELHEASLFMAVASAFALAGTRGAAMPVVWLLALMVLAWLWEKHLCSECEQVEASAVSCVRMLTAVLAMWAAFLSCRCCGFCGAGAITASDQGLVQARSSNEGLEKLLQS
mmetsp:Transcript_59042/g.110634  ORF Transcript_59042/g.110634 Transcript_59042/m.110634 type:complete len:171 (+) Transcript_59042:51-563(+)